AGGTITFPLRIPIPVPLFPVFLLLGVQREALQMCPLCVSAVHRWASTREAPSRSRSAFPFPFLYSPCSSFSECRERPCKCAPSASRRFTDGRRRGRHHHVPAPHSHSRSSIPRVPPSRSAERGPANVPPLRLGGSPMGGEAGGTITFPLRIPIPVPLFPVFLLLGVQREALQMCPLCVSAVHRWAARR